MVYECTLQVRSENPVFSGLTNPLHAGTKKLFCTQGTNRMALKFAHSQDRCRMSGKQSASQNFCICSGPSFIAKYSYEREEK